jgi:hypothetical protein
MMAVAGGDDRWVAMPIFTTRRMFQVGVLVRKDRGIDKPADLKGKKMGVPEYQQTAALWTRGVLQHEYDIHPRDMEFWMERNDDHSQGAVTGFKPPKDVKLSYIPPQTNMGEMLLEGKLDGALRYLAGTNNLVDRSSADLYNHPDFKTIFPDPHAEGVRFYNKTGIYPINHGMVIKREIADHPQAKAAIEDICSTCHMPMARFEAHASGQMGVVASHLDMFNAKPAILPRNTALAMDGVSCTLCHQIRRDNFGMESSFDGGFVIDTATPCPSGRFSA